jgi:hypothetical protein
VQVDPAPDGPARFGAPMTGGFPANAISEQYPYPSASILPVNNHGPAMPPTSPSAAVWSATTQEVSSATNIKTTSSQVIMQVSG